MRPGVHAPSQLDDGARLCASRTRKAIRLRRRDSWPRHPGILGVCVRCQECSATCPITFVDESAPSHSVHLNHLRGDDRSRLRRRGITLDNWFHRGRSARNRPLKGLRCAYPAARPPRLRLIASLRIILQTANQQPIQVTHTFIGARTLVSYETNHGKLDIGAIAVGIVDEVDSFLVSS